MLEPLSQTPDAALAAQQARLPTAIFAPGGVPGPNAPPPPSPLRRAIAAAQLRANTMLRLFKMTMFRISELAKGDGSSGNDLQRVEALMILKPFIGPLVRSIMRNAIASRMPVNQIYMLRTLLRHVANDISSSLSVRVRGVRRATGMACAHPDRSSPSPRSRHL